MSHAFITVVVPFDASRTPHVEAVLDRMGNPPRRDLRGALDKIGIVHFMSLVVVPGDAGEPARLLLEASADGGHDAALRAIAENAVLGAELQKVLAAAGVRIGGPLYGVLYGHSRSLGPSWWSTPGLEFPGTPGMSVRRILDEAALAKRIRGKLPNPAAGLSAYQQLERVRDAIWREGNAKWAFVPEPAPCLAGAPESGLNPIARILFGEAVAPKPIEPIAAARTFAKITLSAAVSFFWPLFALIAAAVAIAWLVGGRAAAWWVLLASLVLVAVGLPIAGIVAYVKLRRREDRDAPEDLEPSAGELAAVMRHETFCAQNLLFSVSTLKRGLLRRLTLRLAFWSVGLVGYFARPGFLGSNRVIHFARWLVVPGTDKMVFLSNYDGTWQGYVGDFVTNAAGAHGVSSIWSNCAGFPRTHNLAFGGAADRDRLVRWARRQQRPVPFWYSAYPHLTTDLIRTNAAIRQGLVSAATQADAEDWLACFGSTPRPADTLQIDEIPTLVFGGLGQLRFAACHVLTFGRNPGACRAWLADIEGEVTFGEVSGSSAAAVVGLSARGLKKLGLPAEARRTFPVAFQQGMTAPYRSRALGDIGQHAPKQWTWGGPGKRNADAVVLVYARSRADFRRVEAAVLGPAVGRGHTIAFSQTLQPTRPGAPMQEPFGFVDGISQPAVRGTRRARSMRDANDLAEPGEFVLGYPDSLGRFPAAPSIAARRDPEHLLPDVGDDPHRQRPEFARAASTGRRDLGCNGTYLVVRQLAQDVNAFNQWLARTAPALGLTEEFLAAKLVGRWRDGTSLVRHPANPAPLFTPPDNDFMFGADDPAGLRCPFGAHIRRANPRDSFAPGSKEQLATTNTHRLLRVGRPYQAAGGADPGLMFMCLNADVERQFEFVQGSWLMNPRFHGLANEIDPILGYGRHATGLTVPTGARPMFLPGLRDFVRPRGGGYFFLPGRTAFRFLARGGRW